MSIHVIAAVDIDMINGRVEWETLSDGNKVSRHLQRCKMSHDGP